MKRLTAILLALAMLTALFSACKGTQGDTTTVTDDIQADVTPEAEASSDSVTSEDETTEEETAEVQTTHEDTTAELAVPKNGYERGYAQGKNGTGKQVAIGLDVSEHQGANFDFKGAKAAGYDFVILRAGHVKFKDKYFEENYLAAREAGLDIGVYLYGYAETLAEVEGELELFLDYIKGKTFEYPVFYDFENNATRTAIGSSGAKAKEMILTMLDGLADAGYLAGVYSSASWFDHAYNGWAADAADEIGRKYEVWIACYGANDGKMAVSTARRYSSIYGMHQFTSKNNTTSFYNYNLDTNVCFKDYPAIVKAYGFNGYEAVGVDNVTFKEGTEFEAPETENIVLDTSSAGKYGITASALNVRSGPSTGYDVIGSLANGAKVEVIGTYNGWGKIEYKGQEGWISMKYAAPDA